MLFSSAIFLFQFLPVVLLVHWIAGRKLRNLVLLLASLFFYAWGETLFVGVMLLSIACNYGFGLWVEADRSRGGTGRLAVACALVFDLGLLVAFKYANWLWALVAPDARALLAGLDPSSLWAQVAATSEGDVRLPIGISFFTFQALSYVIDVQRRAIGAQRNPIDFGLYIALFPQLIAGPIVRYKDIARQLCERSVTREGTAAGIRRFVIGFGKKMLIANTVALPADRIFAEDPGTLPAPVAWFGILCYSLQIYFDFSGYSDMAIGLGRMLGFRFLENFEHPYVARCITDFWRRWHISLSTWFRDYLYIPLGGNRGGALKTARNLVTVFLLCGLWHGASASFVLWGLYHGAFLVCERLGWRGRLNRLPAALRHGYVLLVVAFGWVLFRSPDAGHALRYAGALLGAAEPVPGQLVVRLYLDNVVAAALVAGVVGSTPWLPWLRARKPEALGLRVAGSVGLLAVFLLSILELSAGTYNPFIYFRF